MSESANATKPKKIINIPLPPEDPEIVKQILKREEELDKERAEKKKKLEESGEEERKPRPEVLTPDPECMFQAIGVIRCTMSHEGSQLKVVMNGQEYNLYYLPWWSSKCAYLLLYHKYCENLKGTFRLVVYPRFIHFPGKEVEPQISFQLVAVDLGNEDSAFKKMRDFEFKISGLWQFIPVCRTPCITVMRNFTTPRLNAMKKAPPYKQVQMQKASHLPLLWRDSVVPPFRFNPRLEKEQQGKTYFVSIIAKFMPHRNQFAFCSLQAPPKEQPPMFLKVSKKVKAEAMEAAKERNKKKEQKKDGK